MQRILLLLVCAGFLILTTAASAGAEGHPRAGFLVVRNASADQGVAGSPVVTVVVNGFVIGHVAQEGIVDIYQLPSGTPSPPAQVTGVAVSRHKVTWRTVTGTEFSGSDFRFRAVGGVWRIVIYGSGVSLYAGGVGPSRSIQLHGEAAYPTADGEYSFDGGPFRSLPSNIVTRRFQAK